MRVSKRIPFFTNPCKRLPPKIPNPLPKTSSEAISVEGNCLFYDLKAKAEPAPTAYAKLPPLLRNPVGRVISSEKLMEMRKLRKEDRWTITALSNHFEVSRSFVIKHALTEAEQKQAEEEMHERIDSLSIKEKRGWLMRYKIREHRRDLW